MTTFKSHRAALARAAILVARRGTNVIFTVLHQPPLYEKFVLFVNRTSYFNIICFDDIYPPSFRIAASSSRNPYPHVFSISEQRLTENLADEIETYLKSVS